MTLEESAITATLGGPTQILAPESPQDAQLFQAVEELLDFVCDQGWSKTVIAANYARLPNILVMDDENSRESTLAELIFMVLMDLVKQGGAKMIGNINKPEYEGLRRILGVLSNYLLPLVPASINSGDIFPNPWPIALDAGMLILALVLYLQLLSVDNVPEVITFANLALIFAYLIVLINDMRIYKGRKKKENSVDGVVLEICRHFPEATPASIKATLESILELLECANKES